MKNESEITSIIDGVLAAINIQGRVAIRRRTTPSRGKKGLEVVVMVALGSINEQLFNRFRDAMFDYPEITNVESVNEVEKGAEIDFFVIEALFDFVKGT